MNYEKLLEKYPFLAVIDYNGNVVCGVISSHDKNYINIYIVSDMNDEQTIKHFFNLCEKWWNLSNRKNISIFLKKELQPYKRYLKTLVKSSVKNIDGYIPPMFVPKSKSIIIHD